MERASDGRTMEFELILSVNNSCICAYDSCISNGRLWMDGPVVFTWLWYAYDMLGSYGIDVACKIHMWATGFQGGKFHYWFSFTQSFNFLTSSTNLSWHAFFPLVLV